MSNREVFGKETVNPDSAGNKRQARERRNPWKTGRF
jgi:hypothetical protein